MDIKKILVIDDSPVARKMLMRVVPNKDEYEFVEAGSAKEGLEIYQKDKPDLVFLDLTMPEMDGFQCLEILMKFDENAKVVINSADAQKEAKERVLALGALKIQDKPPSEESMVQLLSWIEDNV
ncbi:MAG: response regulator [Fibrobacterales bacterium]